MACKQEPTKLFFFFSNSVELNREVASYTVLEKSIFNDTVIYRKKFYDKNSNHALLGQDSYVHEIRHDSIFWIRNNGFADKNSLFSSFIVGKCDTTFFRTEKIINCYKGKHDLTLNGQVYLQSHVFYQENRDTNNDFVKKRVYYDSDLVLILEESTTPEYKYFRIERIKSLPFKIPSK